VEARLAVEQAPRAELRLSRVHAAGHHLAGRRARSDGRPSHPWAAPRPHGPASGRFCGPWLDSAL